METEAKDAHTLSTTAEPSTAPAPTSAATKAVATDLLAKAAQPPAPETPTDPVDARESHTLGFKAIAQAIKAATPEQRQALQRRFESPEAALTSPPADPGPVAEQEAEIDTTHDDTTLPAVTEAGNKPPLFRLRPQSDVEERAFWYRRRNPDMPLDEALKLAKADSALQEEPLSMAPQSEPQPQAEAMPPEQGPPMTVAELAQLREQLRQQRNQAKSRYDAQEEARLQQELDRLGDVEPEVQAREGQQVRTGAPQPQPAIAAANQRALEMYPDMADPNGAFWRRMVEIDRAFAETGDPRFDDPRKPITIAQIVAAELNKAPHTSRNPQAPAAAAAPSPSHPQPPKAADPYPVAPIASGNARSQHSSNPLEAVLRKDLRQDEYEALIDSILRR